MSNISLSDNSISLTYPSVLQLNLSADGYIKDGMGNISNLKIGYYNQPYITIGNLEYPSDSSNNNHVLLREDTSNKLIFSNRLYINENNKIIINGNCVLQDGIANDGILIANGNTVSTTSIHDYIQLLTPTSQELATQSNRFHLTTGSKNISSILNTSDDNYIIAKLWLYGSVGTGGGTIEYQNITWNLNEYGLFYQIFDFPYNSLQTTVINTNNINAYIVQVAYLKFSK